MDYKITTEMMPINPIKTMGYRLSNGMNELQATQNRGEGGPGSLGLRASLRSISPPNHGNQIKTGSLPEEHPRITTNRQNRPNLILVTTQTDPRAIRQNAELVGDGCRTLNKTDALGC